MHPTTPNDPWMPGPASPDAPADPALEIETIDGVTPLDAQFGVHPPKTVPDALAVPLFGQPAPTDAEVAHYGEKPVPPLNTYAILDAAKVVNFVEMLQASKLEFRCLFKGKAAQEMRDVAPYVVRLEGGNDFTRNLFSKDPNADMPWFMWDSEPGIYVRSRGSLEDMWKHFRKFTKVQDEEGKWYYQRLYDPKILVYYLDGIKAAKSRVQQIFVPSTEFPILSFLAIAAKDKQATLLREKEPSLQGQTGRAGQIIPDGEALELDARYTQDVLLAAIDLLRKHTPELQDKTDKDLLWLARQNINSFHQFDLISKPVVANALAIVALCGYPLNGLSIEDQELLRNQSQSRFKRTGILLQQIKQRTLA